MKKKIFSLTILIAVIMGSFYYFQNRCIIDGESICYSKRDEKFRIEENANLKVQVENEELGEYLVKTWNVLHPEHEDKITYVVKPPLTLKALLDEVETDIVVTSSHNAAFVIEDMKDLGETFKREVLMKSPKRMQGALNLNGSYFVPNSVNGWTFVYNKTLAKSLGIDLIDSNGSGLPDAFDSFEKIFELDLEENILFPITFIDQYSFYPFLTSGKWELNFTNKGMDPGFKHQEFLKGLDLVVDFKKMSSKSAVELKWQYDSVLEEGTALFSMVNDFMSPHLEVEDEIIYAPFPTYQGNPLTPLGFVDGYMVKKDVQYPSAAAEVLRILRDGDAASYYKTEKTFVYHKKFIEDLEVDDVVLQKIMAYNYTTIDPVIVLEEYPQIMAKDIFYEVDFMPILRDLYDGNINQQQAQDAFINKHNQWLKERVEKLNVESVN